MRKTIAKFRLRRMRMFLVAGMACFGTPLFARAGVKGFPPDQPGEIRHPDALRPAPTVVTPHTPWARDNGGGTTKALFIAPRGVLREVVELYQRTDLDYRVVATDSSKALSGSKKGAKRLIWGTRRADEVLTDLDAALREDYDVIVVGNLLPGLLPGKAWNVIGRHVRRGGGLIACPAKGTDEDNESLHNLVGEAQALTFPNTVGNAFPAPVRDAYLAGWGTGESLPFDTYTLGRGRVVVSRYVPGKWSMVVPGVSVRDNLENRCLFDYQHAVSARVLLWAARRLPGEEMNPFSVSSEVTANSAAVTVDWTTADDHTDVTWLELRVRDKHNHDLYRAVLPASEGVRFDVPLQALPVGEHFVDIWFRDARNRTLDWRTTMLSVADPQGIAELSAEPDFVTPELPVTAVIDLKQKLAKDESLALSIRDFHGRVTARKAVRGETGDTFEVKVNVGTPLSIICDLDVELWRGNRLVDRKEAEIAVDQPPKGPGWDDFSWLYWCFRDNVVPQQAMRRLLPYGLDRVLVERGSVDRHVEETRLVAKTLNAKSYPYAWGLQKIPHQMNPDGLVRKMTELAPKLDKYSCDTVNLGDENSLSRDHKAFSKRMKPTFQEAMKEQYETLDALNAAWGTDFTEWGQVTGIDLEGAQKIGQRTRFFDTRRYMDTIFARFHKLGVEAAQQASSHYRVGFEGVWRTEWWRGYDWQKIMSSVNLIGNYAFAPAEADIVGSFKPDDLYWTLWNGAYMDVHNRWFQGWVPWHCLLQGMNATAWWCSLPGSAHANPFHIFYPDLRISPEVLPFLESVREIKSGLGKLLIGAERYDYGIGIHYSQASIYADALDDYGFNTPGKGVPSRIQNSWLNFLYGLGDGGFQGRFVSYAQVEQGDFGDAKVVILPFSQAISRREAASLRNFVEAGGVLLADIRPAVFDDKGGVVEKGLLNKVFGISRPGMETPMKETSEKALHPDQEKQLKIETKERMGYIGERKTLALEFESSGNSIELSLPHAQVDHAVVLAEGTARAGADNTPVMIENTVGRGRALLLNFATDYSMAPYGSPEVERVRGSGDDDAWVTLLRAVLAEAGVEPELKLTSGGERLRGIETVTWHDGSARYYGFAADDFCDFALVCTGPVRAVKGTLRDGGHVYDVRSGEYLGEGDTFEYRLPRGGTAIIAVLPYRVESIEAGEAGEDVAGGGPVRVPFSVKPAGGRAGRHVLRVRAFDPEGRERPEYAANVEAADGQCIYSLPLALSDPEGAWSIIARDVATGVETTVTVTIN